MSSELQEQWLNSATHWAKAAGEIIKEARTNAKFNLDYKSGHELVTSTDLAVDRYLCEQIRATYPEHLILSEESSPDLMLANQHQVPVWVIDPIDGTVNFAQGLLHVAVSIAVYCDGICHVGVVYAPFLDECYSAIVGQGALLNERPIRVSGKQSLRNAIVATGFPYVKDDIPVLVKRLESVLSHCQDVRRNGSAALDLCAVANGTMDAYYESVKPWDMAAGALIAKEAGAIVGHFDVIGERWPEAINGDYMLTATPDLYHLIEQLLILPKK